ncbi:unnamed protein product, partial [Prorocentrum cordatum]
KKDRRPNPEERGGTKVQCFDIGSDAGHLEYPGHECDGFHEFKKDFGIGQSRMVECGVEVGNRFEQLGQDVGDESMGEQERYDDDQHQDEKEQEANESSTQHTQQGSGAGGWALLRALEKCDADGNGCVTVAELRIMLEECDLG